MDVGPVVRDGLLTRVVESYRGGNVGEAEGSGLGPRIVRGAPGHKLTCDYFVDDHLVFRKN